MDWQTITSLVIVALAAVWGGRMLYTSVASALKPAKTEGCGGGCGCHASTTKKGCESSSKLDAT
jgi:hypothetical protein